MSALTSKDESTQSGEHKNSSKKVIRNVIPFHPPLVINTKDFLSRNFYAEVFSYALSPWYQYSTELSMQNMSNSYPRNAAYHHWLNFTQKRWYPLSEYFWNVDDNGFIISPKREYKDQLIYQSFLNHHNLFNGFIKYAIEFNVPLNGVKRAVPNKLHEKVIKTVSPNQMHVYGSKQIAVLTGFFKGRYTNKFALTVGHLVDNIGEALYVGNELLGHCRFKCETMQIAQQRYSADLSLIAIDPKSRYASDMHTVIEIQGKRYWPKLCNRMQIHDINLESEVWIIDQSEKLKIGKVVNPSYSNENAGLHNVMQITGMTDVQAPTTLGDSGCCVCLPPEPDSNTIEVIALVISTSKLQDGTTYTNAMPLRLVLEHALRNLPSELKKVGDFCEDEGLPENVDFSEGLEFYVGDKSENLAVQTETGIVAQSHDSGVGSSGIAPLSNIKVHVGCLEHERFGRAVENMPMLINSFV